MYFNLSVGLHPCRNSSSALHFSTLKCVTFVTPTSESSVSLNHTLVLDAYKTVARTLYIFKY